MMGETHPPPSLPPHPPHRVWIRSDNDSITTMCDSHCRPIEYIYRENVKACQCIMEASYIAIVILVILLVVSNVTWGLYPYYHRRQTPICIEMDADWRVSKVIIINGDHNGGINEPRYSNVTQLCRKLKYTFERSPSMFVTSPEYIDSCGHVNTNDKGVKTLCGCMFAHKIALQKIVN